MNFPVQPMTLEVEEEPAPISLRAMWAAVLRRWRFAASVFGGAAVLTLLIIAIQPPRYASTATIMIRPGLDREVTDLAPETGGSPQAATLSAAVDSEVEVLRSHQVARRVVDRLQLTADREWNGLGMRGLLPGAGGDAEALADETARNLTRAVKVRRQALSEVVEVEVEARRPARAAEIANTYVQAYLEFSVESHGETSARATAWLDERLRALQANLREKEAALANFRAASGLYVGTGESLSDQQVRALQDSIVVARTELAEKTARHEQLLDLIRRGGNADSISSALTSDVIRDLRSQEALLSRTQADLEGRLQERHPFVIAGREQLADVRAQIQSEMRRIAANAEGEVAVSRARLQALEASLGTAGGNIAGASDAEVQLAQLTREATAAQTVYDIFLQRYHQMASQGEIAPLQMRLISPAVAPDQPTWPNWPLAFLIALACGAIIAGLALLATEMLTDPVASGEELERRVGAMTLAAVPFVSPRTLRLLPPEARHPAGYLTDSKLSAYAEAFRNLRTSLRFAGGAHPAKVIVISSPNPNEGKTTCALSLARVSALAGQKVILIDCDIRRCALNGIMSIAPEVGLWHVLSGQADWQGVAGVDDVTPAHILPSAPGEFASADMLSGGAMDELLDEMREHYDLVILDCPPVGAVADTRLLAAKADGVVLVSRWNKTSVREVSTAIRHLAPSGARLLGVVVNGVDGDVARWAGYGEYEFKSYAAA